MSEKYFIVIFDGVCNLCNSSINYVIEKDKTGVFKFAPLQGRIAKEQVALHHPGDFAFDTIVLIKNGIWYERSDAVIEILKELPRHKVLGNLLKVIPRPIRDFFYNRVARNRYRLWGKKDTCMVPTEEIRGRFLE